MAESDCADCRCTNISIMQLFHELKQSFPTVPDQIVSKVIEQNFHDKTACETILRKESHSYVQCYPGALISGDGRSAGPSGPLSHHCSAPHPKQQTRSIFCQTATSDTQCCKVLSAVPTTPDSVVSASEPRSPHSRQRAWGLTRQNAVGGISCPVQNSTKPLDHSVQLSDPCSAGKQNVKSRLSHSDPRRQTASDVSLPHTPTSDCDKPGAVYQAPIVFDEDRTQRQCEPYDSTYEPSRRFTLDDETISVSNSTTTPPNFSDKSEISNPTAQSGCVIPRSRPLSLEEKIELTKIPLGQLVREARERHHDNISNTTPVDPHSVVHCEPEKINHQPENEPVNEIVESSALSKNKDSDVSSLVLECPKSQCIADSSSNLSVLSPSKESLPVKSDGERETHETEIPEPVCDKQPLTLKGDSPSRLQESVIRSVERAKSPLNCSSSLPHAPFSSENSKQRLLPPPVNPSFYRAPRPSNLEIPEETVPDDYQVAVECLISPGNRQRSFTSVNLTLRPPSTETTLPIEISSGQSLTYSTSRFDKRQGYQSQLQIRISKHGSSVTACRNRVSSPMMRTPSRSPCRAGALCHSKPHLRALLQEQRLRKDVLARELHREKEKLRNMRIQVRAMEDALHRKPSPIVLSKLKSEIDQLRNDCERLTTAVDLYSGQGNFPLGETDEDFYRNIYTGQRPQRNGWSCRVCTFRNHPLLSVCEECEMPRSSIGTASCDHLVACVSNPLLPNNNSSCAAEETSTSVSRTIAPLQER